MSFFGVFLLFVFFVVGFLLFDVIFVLGFLFVEVILCVVVLFFVIMDFLGREGILFEVVICIKIWFCCFLIGLGIILSGVILYVIIVLYNKI